MSVSLSATASECIKRSDRGLDSVPNELLEEIVLDAVGNYFEDPVSYVVGRTRILFSCVRLCLLVLKCPRLWSSYTLSPNKTFLELRQMAKNWSTSPLNLHLVFVGDGEPSTPASEGCASLEDTLKFFVEHAPRCADLRLDIDSFLEIPVVFHALDRSQFSILRAVTMVWSDCRLAFSPSLVRVLNVPLNSQERHNITTLRLFHIPFNWFQLSHFTGLTILVLHFRNPEFAPGASHLATMLRSNPFLTKVSMRLHIARHPSPKGYIDPITLPCLLALDMDWYESHSLIHEFVSMFRMPNVQELSYFISGADDVEIFHALANNCHSVTTLYLSGGIPNPAAGARILRAFARVVDLDVSSMGGYVWSSVFMEDARSRWCLAKALKTLTVQGFKAQDLRAIAEARKAKGYPLEAINCHQIRHCMYGSQSFPAYRSALLYLIDNVPCFNVRNLKIGGVWTRSTEWFTC
ncbi:hypothetical protein C8R47DRAFT_1314517 [Mycena vitilis]|nr:hypothetical protein C8R47DRAFT_1314517 [Mycena vitilis]